MGNRETGKTWRMKTKMLGVGLWLALIFPLPLFPSSPVPRGLNDAAPISTATREGRLAVFDDAWARINDRYYDETFHGLDCGAPRTTFCPLAAAPDSSE